MQFLSVLTPAAVHMHALCAGPGCCSEHPSVVAVAVRAANFSFTLPSIQLYPGARHTPRPQHPRHRQAIADTRRPSRIARRPVEPACCNRRRRGIAHRGARSRARRPGRRAGRACGIGLCHRSCRRGSARRGAQGNARRPGRIARRTCGIGLRRWNCRRGSVRRRARSRARRPARTARRTCGAGLCRRNCRRGNAQQEARSRARRPGKTARRTCGNEAAQRARPATRARAAARARCACPSVGVAPRLRSELVRPRRIPLEAGVVVVNIPQVERAPSGTAVVDLRHLPGRVHQQGLAVSRRARSGLQRAHPSPVTGEEVEVAREVRRVHERFCGSWLAVVPVLLVGFGVLPHVRHNARAHCNVSWCLLDAGRRQGLRDGTWEAVALAQVRLEVEAFWGCNAAAACLRRRRCHRRPCMRILLRRRIEHSHCLT